VLRGALYAVWAAPRQRAPVLWHARVTGTVRRADRWLDRWLLTRCARVITISPEVAQRFSGMPGQCKVVCIEHGMEVEIQVSEQDVAACRQRLGVAPGVPAVAIVGSLEPRKGHEVLLRALPAVVAKHPQLRCVIAGVEPAGGSGYQARMEALGRALGIEGHLIWAGFVEQVPRLLAGMMCGVFPVIQPEGFGRVVIEAAAVGRPTIATPLGALGRVIEDGRTGLLVPPGDAGALAAALNRLLGDPGLAARLGEAARRRAIERYRLDRVMRDVHALYEEVLREAHP
jgi:glycosyltransferase involved in cell wall biosynthesis